MEKLKICLPKWLGARITQIYLFSMLAVFPFFFTDRMFRLHLDKRDFLLVSFTVYMCVLFPLFMITVYDWGNAMSAPKKADTIFALVLFPALALSTIFTVITPKRAFFEMSSRTVSGLCFLCCIFIFFAVRQYGKADKFLLWTWIAGSSGLYLFGILCACGINVLHIQDGLTLAQLSVYLTPLSNTNYNTCYVCLMLPPIMVMYVLGEKPLTRILCGANLYLGFLFTFFIKTDSSIIALLLGVILLGYFALETESWSAGYIRTIGIYLSAKITIRILLRLFPGKLYAFHGLPLFLLNNRLLVCEIISYVLFFLIWRWKKEIIQKPLTAARKTLAIIGAVSACAFVAFVFFVNIYSANLPAGSFWNRFVLNDSTFSRRGSIWIKTISVLKEEPFARKIFGNGLNSFYSLMRMTHSHPEGSIIFEDPHNEILQMATDMGLLGLIGYFGLLFTSLVKGLRGWRKNKLHIITILTLSVYMVQALANEYSIFTLPLLFIFLGLVNSTGKTTSGGFPNYGELSSHL